MIKFFRHIRKDLMESGKTGKYLKYAIGEILLVVIGILIALQINNWNQKQKQLRLEKEILSEVKIGLEGDIEAINTSITENEEFIKSQEIIVDWINSKSAYNDSLMPHFKHTTWVALFFPKDAQFESLKQFGLRNISNAALRDQISKLYDNMYQDLLYWQDEYKNTSLHFRRMHASIGFEFVNDSSYILLDNKPLRPVELQKNSGYLFELIGTSSTLKIFTDFKLKAAKKEIEKTMSMIDEELSKE